MGYIIDTYSHWNKWEREHQRYVFEINETIYAVYELDGTLPTYIDKEFDLEEHMQYKSLEAAKIFARTLRKLNN